MCSMLICRGSSRVQHLVIPSILVLTSTYIYSSLYYTKKRRRRKKSQQISFCSCCKHCIFVIMYPEFSTTTICFYVNSRQFTCNKKKTKISQSNHRRSFNCKLSWNVIFSKNPKNFYT